MSVRTVPRPNSIDQGIASMSTEYGITCEIGNEAYLSGELECFG
jgi:hypothetical protein